MADDERPRIPCQKCGEQISVDATECPHCGDKKWTKDRYHAYMLLFVPMTAAVVSFILYPMFSMSNPEVTIWWFAGMLIVFYVLGAIMTEQKRDAYLDHLQEEGRRAGKRDSKS